MGCSGYSGYAQVRETLCPCYVDAHVKKEVEEKADRRRVEL